MVLARMYKQKGFLFWNMPITFAAGMALIGYFSVVLLSGMHGEAFRILNDVPLAIGYLGVLVFVYKVSEKLLKPVHDFMISIGELSYYFYFLHGFIMLVGFSLAMKTGLPHSRFYAVPLILLSLYIFSIGYKTMLVRFHLI